MPADISEDSAMLNHIGSVQSQFHQGRTTDRRQWNDFAMIFAPRKVIEPTVAVRMIQPHFSTCFRIESGRRRGLRAVASRAGIAQVGSQVRAATSSRDDVLDVELAGADRFLTPTILGSIGLRCGYWPKRVVLGTYRVRRNGSRSQ